MKIIDGKLVQTQICDELRKEIEELKSRNIVPTLKIIQVGDNQASNVYVRNKIKLSETVGINTTVDKLPENITETELINRIKDLNNDENINGILVQLPIPSHLSEKEVIETIVPDKDVDCFNLVNVGKLWTAKKQDIYLKPCTPCGVIEMLKKYNIEMSGKHVVIIGRSNIVGKPQAALFLLENATVTICHSKTTNLKEVCKQADILVAAVGRAKMINHEYIKQGAVVIDVGMNRDENNKLCGDVDFEDVKDIVSYITPVPGGVGPMTITILLKNLINVTKLQNK
nr:bifunctional protein FolD [uncultured Mycoplasmataceae bacterium]